MLLHHPIAAHATVPPIVQPTLLIVERYTASAKHIEFACLMQGHWSATPLWKTEQKPDNGRTTTPLADRVGILLRPHTSVPTMESGHMIMVMRAELRCTTYRYEPIDEGSILLRLREIEYSYYQSTLGRRLVDPTRLPVGGQTRIFEQTLISTGPIH